MAHPTLQDVCKLAGTSDATASMILNGSQGHKFRPETREQVLRAAKTLGYVPQHAAQTLRTGKSYNIATLLNDLGNPFFARYASILQRELLDRGYTAIPLETNAAQERESELLQWSMHRNIDGVIDLQGMLQKNMDVYEQFAAQLPLVIRSATMLPGQVRGHVVHVDYLHGLKRIAHHFAEIGCKTPGVITVDNHMPDRQKDHGDSQWTRQCKQAFTEAGIPIQPEHWFAAGIETKMQPWYEVARTSITPDCPIDCLVVHSAALVPAVLRGFTEAGRHIGKDLAVATFDDPPELTYLGGGITTVREPMEEIVHCLVEGLISRIAKPDQPGRTRIIATEIIIRHSTTAFQKSRTPARRGSASNTRRARAGKSD